VTHFAFPFCSTMTLVDLPGIAQVPAALQYL